MIGKENIRVWSNIVYSEFLTDKDMIKTFTWFPRGESIEMSAALQACIFFYHMQHVGIEIPSQDNGILRSTDNADYLLYLLIPDDRTETEMDDKEMDLLPINVHDTLPQDSLDSRTCERMELIL